MARKHFLINRHTPNQTGFPSDLKLGEIAVRHNENAPELIINLREGGDESDFRTFIDKVAIEKLFETFNTNLSGEIDSLSGVVEAHIEAVETKFEDYYTSAQTDDAIAIAKGEAVGAASAYTDTQVKSAKETLSGLINGVDSKVETIASSAMTEIEKRAIKTEVDTLVANTSAATYNAAYGAASAYTDTQVKSAKETLSGLINGVASRVESLESLSAATQSAIQTIEVSGVDGVKVSESGTSRTIDFSDMTIDCGTF